MFDRKAPTAARALGAREIEIMGIEVANPWLRDILIRGGFAPTTGSVSEELGGGIFNAISRVEPVN
jgi:hypothetical protein